MSENGKKNDGWLGAVIPRRNPGATDPEQWAESAERRGGLLGLHPAVKIADDYVDKIVRRLADVVEAVKNSTEQAEKAYETGSVVIDANGNGTITIQERMGVDYDVERVATVCTGAAAAVSFFLNEVSDAGLIGSVPNGSNPQRFAGDIASGLYVPRGNKLVVQFTGCTAGSNAFVRMQVSRRFIKQGGTVA